MPKHVESVDHAIELIQSSFSSSNEFRVEERHLADITGDNELLHKKLGILEQYLAKKFLNEDELNNGKAIEIAKIVDPLLEIVTSDFSSEEDVIESARGIKAQEEACICLGLIRYGDETELALRVQSVLKDLQESSTNELIVDVARANARIIGLQIAKES